MADAKGPTRCAHCKAKAATCVGRYEGHGPVAPACDDCCGHGNEDGWCVVIEQALLDACERLTYAYENAERHEATIERLTEARAELVETLRRLQREAATSNNELWYQRITGAIGRAGDTKCVQCGYDNGDRDRCLGCDNCGVSPWMSDVGAAVAAAANANEAEREAWRRSIAHELRTQDDCHTADAIQMVQEEVTIYGVDSGYTDEGIWVDGEESEAVDDDDLVETLDALREDQFDDEVTFDGRTYHWVGVAKRWENIQPFLTRKAALAYCETQKKRHEGPLRVFVESAYRNPEWRELRRYFLAAEEQP